MKKAAVNKRKLNSNDRILRPRQVGELLGISEATVRNWAKLGKINVFSTSPLCFLEKDILALHQSLENSGLLKSRRNKTRLNGHFIPKSYISSTSPNYPLAKELLESVAALGLSKDSLIPAVIGTVAKELLGLRKVPGEISRQLLEPFDFSEQIKELAGTFDYIYGEDLLGMLYLSLRGLRDKKNTGAYYTPYFVVDRLISEIISYKTNPDSTFEATDCKDIPTPFSGAKYCAPTYGTEYSLRTYCDPACGTGNFLIRLPDYIPLTHVYGYDIDETAVFIARINLALKYAISSQTELETIAYNIKCRDFLLTTENIDNNHLKDELAANKLLTDEHTAGSLLMNEHTRALTDSALESSSNRHCFDVILGNPPWGYVYTKDEIALIHQNYNSYQGSKMPESFSLFVEKATESLNEGGLLSFLLPETILGADMHREIRNFMLEKASVSSLVYLDEVFDKVQCPSVILKLIRHSVKSEKPHSTSMELHHLRGSDTTTPVEGPNITVSFEQMKRRLPADSKEKHGLSYASDKAGKIIDTSSSSQLTVITNFTSSPDRITPDSFHILCDDAEYALLKKIRSAPHFTLKDNADFALGIVTGSNSTLLKSTPDKGFEPILKGKDIEKYCIRQATNFVQFKPGSFQQCAPTQMYRAGEKLFYRFIADEPIVALDSNQTLSLNSANIIIPHVEGYSTAYIMALLNSKVLSFYYKKSFRNMKVLRSYLEDLPLAECEPNIRKEIEELALSISRMAAEQKAFSNNGYAATAQVSDFEEIQLRLESKIAGLYGLTKEEIRMTSL
ncbi:TaqI-like C-terminal specificity domain-containing protein [Butyrivibrio sp. AE2032]|uniref:TaqI-like C-terminal specificity domain-containing protein n=1 Tax=Butyrivibrio sp. AE2032 TaxID=1458463 RepID=UPI000552CDD9|nr:TaqI-like C-terminal specificity domain-containing protein [Butyrivibrio sp. AE2032]